MRCRTGGTFLHCVHSPPTIFSASVTSCVWSCLVSNCASGHVSPRVASCVTGDPSPQVEAYYWPNPVGPADPDKSAVNATPQPSALIGSDRHSGPYASSMPLDPRCRQVCVCVPFTTTLFSTCCWGFMSLVSFPSFPRLNSTQCSGQLSVCLCESVLVRVRSCFHV